MAKILIILFFLLPFAAFAQFSISGKVLNHDDARPIANVNVFLNNATIGDKTTVEGVFNLRKVKPGKYDLIVTIVGFSTYSESITVNSTNLRLPDIYLSPKATASDEVKIKSKEKPDSHKNLELFKEGFLGTSDLAKECKIINPEVLDFNYDEKAKTLEAKSVDFLEIENRALGYRVKYLLSDFNYDQNTKQFLYGGAVFFEELNGTTEQEQQWGKRRQEVYANSSTHFLRAALKNKLDREGFSVLRFLTNPDRPTDSLISAKVKIFTAIKDKPQYRDSLSFWERQSNLPRLLPKQVPVTLTADDVIKKTNKQELYAFGNDNEALYIIYNKFHQANATSLMHLSDQNNTSSTLVIFNAPFAFLDNRGAIINPESLSFAGVWANKRVAELLPATYEPPQTEQTDNTIEKIDSTLKTYIAGHSIEKAYLHFDKPYYAAGDTIYFKAYVTNSLYEPSNLSDVLNAELISSDNNILETIKLKLIDGMATGDVAITDTLKKGYYRLRAYTSTMRDAGEEYFFDQYLFITNVPKVSQAHKTTPTPVEKETSKSLRSKTALSKIRVQFFPEGGNLVTGVTSKIAFKAVAPDGLGVDIHGTITDEHGKQLGVFVSQHLGMGIMTLTPQAGTRYKANITYADSSEENLDLPQADDTGYALNVDNSDSRYIRVNVTAGQQNHEAQINLVAQSGGIIYSYAAGKLVNNKFTALLPKNQFPNGIVQFTLFSANGEPMNERLVFIGSQSQLNLKLETADSIYYTRQKVKINLTAIDMEGQPVVGNYSVAVTDETEVPVEEDSESTILTNLLLTSDLKGYVEKPNYYFNGKNSSAKADLDVLMLTQGYHRFEWKQILNNKFGLPVSHSESISTVSGKITNLNGKPVPYGKVSLLSVSNIFFSLDTTADANGKFVFKHLLIKDSVRYIIQASDEQLRKNSLIEIDNLKPPIVNGNKNTPDGIVKDNSNLTVYLTAYLNFSTSFHQEQLKQGIVKHAIALKEVTIKGKAEKKYLKHSDNLNGAGKANDVITADQLPPGSPSFKDAIIGHLHGIKYLDGNFYYGFFPSLILLDGFEIQGNLTFSSGRQIIDPRKPSMADVLNTVPVSEIESVEIITDASLAAIYGVRGAGGVIIITTKRADDKQAKANSNFRPNFSYYSPVGYYKARVFYSPRYDVTKTNPAFADLRTTIYWNPNIITDKGGRASFEFFNADTKGDYRIVVEGIDDNGHLGRQVYHYRTQ
jgi:TonB-dependent SusC/RagA subfamily outer membrane receptor